MMVRSKALFEKAKHNLLISLFIIKGDIYKLYHYYLYNQDYDCIKNKISDRKYSLISNERYLTYNFSKNLSFNICISYSFKCYIKGNISCFGRRFYIDDDLIKYITIMNLRLVYIIIAILRLLILDILWSWRLYSIYSNMN